MDGYEDDITSYFTASDFDGDWFVRFAEKRSIKDQRRSEVGLGFGDCVCGECRSYCVFHFWP